MGVFKTKLVTSTENDKKDILIAPLIYSSTRLGVIIVPSGFETDFASVPRIPLAYMLFGGVAKQAAVVHDFLYSQKNVKRNDADSVFLEAMEDSGVSFFRRYSMYAAVRAFGWTVRK